MKMIFSNLKHSLPLILCLFSAFPLSLSANQSIRVSVLSIFKSQSAIIHDGKETWQVEISGNGILVNKKEEPLFSRQFESGFWIEIPGKIKRHYAGTLEILNQDKQLLLVNAVKINDYLESVVFFEMGNAPLEALKAQTVLSRTLALKRISENSSGLFHVTDLTDSQVYKGRIKENKKIRQAVLETENLVLKFENKLPPVFFSSTCGGKTTTPGRVWGNEEPGYEGVECQVNHETLCSESSHFSWYWKVKISELEKIFKTAPIQSLNITEKDSSGRAVFISLIHETGATLKISGSDFHRNIGKYYKNWGLLKSTCFEIKTDDEYAFFLGRGLGHGVGLCQYGAQKLARKGYHFMQILKFYYPRMNVENF